MEGAASTGETAIKAAAYSLGASIATRYVMGRSRPTDGLGNTHFGGFRSGAWQSGFPSNHVAVAFALATPFAQQHDMPWLYGVAAATAFGRVQKRQHWVSDTVAGAAMGYAIGLWPLLVPAAGVDSKDASVYNVDTFKENFYGSRHP